jgi:nitrate reductase NapE component
VPLLETVQQRRATVTYGGYSTSMQTHSDSRMAYFDEGYHGGNPRAIGAETTRQGPVERATSIYNALRERQIPESEAKILAAIASGEGNFQATQAIDRVRFSWGFIQFQGASLIGVLRRLRSLNAAQFASIFESHGLMVRERGQPAPRPQPAGGRYVPGADRGQPNSEAGGVDDLRVYDHAAHQWRGGNDALAVIQADPRYQALFIAAGGTPDGQLAQLMSAIDGYVHRMRNLSVDFGGRPPVRLRVSEFVHSEVVMWPLISRAVGGGTDFVTPMFQAFVRRQGIAPADIASHQAELAAFVRSYTAPGLDIQWQRTENLRPPVPGLRPAVYDGNP